MIAADPRPVAPKLLLIHASIAARHDALAVAVAKQLLPDFFREDAEATEWVAKSFLPNLETAERASLARGLADAQQRLGNVKVAFLYANIAQYIAPSDATRRLLDNLRAQLDNALKNDARRPLISDSIDQDRLVRPKVGAQ
jgi:hypothetical protein